ncbi:hypothetical protein NE237_014855 [Protea cynaroides]|uniref:Uncharacterized protein n=1 Tax=Protea cynaroides TaxID=273540 RepID=A0A9Q0KD23_9MAGN|nr:hypothetical protein NE237_014855 [Protea cynaroides]
MEKKPSDSNSKNSCEKFCNCLFINPFRSRRNSRSLQDAAPCTNCSAKEIEKLSVHIPIHEGQEGMKVAPNTDPQKEKPKNKAEVAPMAEQGKIVIEGEPSSQGNTGKEKELKRTGTEVMNDKSADYISRTKLKFWSMSSFSGGKSGSFK